MRDDADTMVAYHGDPAVKAALLDRIADHEHHDAIAQQTYGSPREGGEVTVWERCAVGCSVHDLASTPQRDDGSELHALYPRLLGIPIWLAYLEDRIFEGLEWPDAKDWPRRFAEAIPVGGSFEGLEDRLVAGRLRDLLEIAGSWSVADRALLIDGADALEAGDRAWRALVVEAAEVRAGEFGAEDMDNGAYAATRTVAESVATTRGPRVAGVAWWAEAMDLASPTTVPAVWLLEADRLVAELARLPWDPRG